MVTLGPDVPDLIHINQDQLAHILELVEDFTTYATDSAEALEHDTQQLLEETSGLGADALAQLHARFQHDHDQMIETVTLLGQALSVTHTNSATVQSTHARMWPTP